LTQQARSSLTPAKRFAAVQLRLLIAAWQSMYVARQAAVRQDMFTAAAAAGAGAAPLLAAAAAQERIIQQMSMQALQRCC
jgi:hypothetical protein